MSQRRRTPEAVANPARGAALVVVAVLVGLFLLRNGLDTSEVVTSSPTDGASVDGGATDGTASGTDDGVSTTTTLALRPPAEVSTIVLNGSGVAGSAKRWSTYLASQGYALTNAEGGNASANTPATAVYYGVGFEQEAAALIDALAAAAPAIAGVTPQPMPTASLGATNSAQVVVVLGPDLGAVTPPATN